MWLPDETARLIALLEPLFAGEIDAGQQRMDFADFDTEPAVQERTTQIMQVHDFGPRGAQNPATLRAASCTIHHGNMLHMADGNVTPDRRRRTLILNYHSADMIAWERARGYDHRSENARNDGAPQARTLHPGGRR